MATIQQEAGKATCAMSKDGSANGLDTVAVLKSIEFEQKVIIEGASFFPLRTKTEADVKCFARGVSGAERVMAGSSTEMNEGPSVFGDPLLQCAFLCPSYLHRCAFLGLI